MGVTANEGPFIPVLAAKNCGSFRRQCLGEERHAQTVSSSFFGRFSYQSYQQVKLWKQRGTKNADRGPSSYLSFATPSKLKTNQVAWQLETSVKQWESMRLTLSCSLAISLRQRDVSHLLALSDSIPFVKPFFLVPTIPTIPTTRMHQASD